MHTDCKFETVLEILVGKWKPVIMFQLFTNGTMRFSELQRAIPAITKKMLTQQLRELEYHDIVHRKVYHQIPPKVEYSITEHGRSMGTIMEALNDWGRFHTAHLNQLYGEDEGRQSETFVDAIDNAAE
ncbi:winged helix-turn-helix transcriptional regulator [Paenibacillus whitsoniae]|uniref:Transcriptional regulator n=1 Tax=Paenibacillus whitsoniae TaxID=2496558 RepID=A0A430J8I9_9BACL|nr:helix-turn-helix domain-containing protein [Paenibacillus whitsoniae]RTE06424.1 transcriptional regulator [Paenibacillus whitsoniae]